MDLIDRESVLEELEELEEEWEDARMCVPSYYYDAKRVIRNAKAVEKQVPKRAYVGTEEQFRLWHCPACKMPIHAGTNYCSDCGQKLEWS